MKMPARGLTKIKLQTLKPVPMGTFRLILLQYLIVMGSIHERAMDKVQIPKIIVDRIIKTLAAIFNPEGRTTGATGSSTGFSAKSLVKQPQ
jgi:hypothetical protein